MLNRPLLSMFMATCREGGNGGEALKKAEGASHTNFHESKAKCVRIPQQHAGRADPCLSSGQKQADLTLELGGLGTVVHFHHIAGPQLQVIAHTLNVPVSVPCPGEGREPQTELSVL